MELDLIKRVIHESGELSKQGEDRKALKLLDDTITEASQENHARWVSLLSRHASAIAEHIGDLNLVRQYREQCASHEPENPLTLSSLADVLHRQGEEALARQYAAKAYRASIQRGTELDRSVVESLLQTWPDLAQSHP